MTKGIKVVFGLIKVAVGIYLIGMVLSLQSCSKNETVEPTSTVCKYVQCSATAASTGKQCSFHTTNCNGRCGKHQ
jgi:hypothetical protein